MRTLSLAAALVGAISWVANLYADVAALAVTGTVLLGVAVLVIGSRLARQRWLGVVAAAGSVALAGSLLELLRDGYADRVLEGVLGGLVGLLVAVAVVRTPRAEPVLRAGNHRG